jgi:hypothetical protein
MNPTVLRVSEPREILAFIPHCLGFQPRESVVAVSLRGRRLGLVARVDVADLGHPERGPDVAGGVAEHLRADGATRVVLVLYTSDDLREARSGRGAGPRALDRMRSALPHGWRSEEWVVTPEAYASTVCEDEHCCPPGGRPLSDLESTQVGAHMVLTGSAVEPDRASLGVVGRAPEGDRRSTEVAYAQERVRRADVGRSADDLASWADRMIETWRGLWAEPGGDPVLAGRILVALEDVVVRDEVIASMTSGSCERVFGPGGSGRPDRYRPDRPVVERARQVLEAVVRHAPEGAGAAPLAVLAWLAWWSGEGARAGVLVGQCLAEDSTHGLGRLVDDLLRLGIPPGWVESDRGAPWRGSAGGMVGGRRGRREVGPGPGRARW